MTRLTRFCARLRLKVLTCPHQPQVSDPALPSSRVSNVEALELRVVHTIHIDLNELNKLSPPLHWKINQVFVIGGDIIGSRQDPLKEVSSFRV